MAVILLGLVGGVVWTGALSPVGYHRFSVVTLDRTLDIDRAGTYLVFEEFAGASEPDLPSPLDVSVFATDGRPVDVRPLIEPGERAAPHGYRLLSYEGRAIAEFTVPRPGRYLVQVRPLAPESVEESDFRAGMPHTIAVGRDLTTTWLGSWVAAILMGPLPVLTGIALLVVWRRRSRAARRPGSESGDVERTPVGGGRPVQ